MLRILKIAAILASLVILTASVTIFVAFNKVQIKPFNVYWNIPTFMCKKYKIDFTGMSKYGVIQNRGDEFRGEQFAILYEPELFPALLKNGTSDQLVVRNGGVPQAGDTEAHLERFEQDVNKLIKDKNFSGIGVIDFEMWRPIFRHNFVSLKVYKNFSVELVRKRNLGYNESQLEKEVRREFEVAGKEFMSKTLTLAKKLRPKASWGYYAYPYCFNMNGAKDESEDCSERTQQENDQLGWLFEESDIIFPSTYLHANIKPEDRIKVVRGRVREAIRVVQKSQKKPKPRVLTYMRYVHVGNSDLLEQEVWDTVLNGMKEAGSDGVVLWGSSNDLRTKEKCVEFKEYVDKTLGPLLKRHSESN